MVCSDAVVRAGSQGERWMIGRLSVDHSLRMVAKAADHGGIQEPREICIVSSEPSIQTNVDVFSENGGYFVRTEIEARIVQVHGPVADAETAKRQQADQVARLKASTDALRKELQRASSASGS